MTSRERWDRMEAVLADMRSPQRIAKKGWYNTPEYTVLQREYCELRDIERNEALARGWPVWQEGQVFIVLDADGSEWDGYCTRYDLDAETVTGDLFPLGDTLARLRSDRWTRRTVQLAQVQHWSYFDARNKAQADAEKARQWAEAHPLFADCEVTA